MASRVPAQPQQRRSTPVSFSPRGGPPRWAPALPKDVRGDVPVHQLAHRFVALLAPSLGAGAAARLRDLVESAASWATEKWNFEAGPRAPFFWAAFRRAYRLLCREVPLHRLAVEWMDERLLVAARTGDKVAVARWLAWVDEGVGRLRKRYRGRWHVPGLDFEDVRGHITVELLERLDKDCRGQREGAWPPPVAGEARSLIVANLVRKRLQRRRLLAVALEPAEMVSLAEKLREERRTPGPEAAYLAEECRAVARRFRDAVQDAPLSRIQRGWLVDIEEEAKAAERALNLSSLAARRGVSPSAASRMRASLAQRLKPIARRLDAIDEE